MRKIHNGKVSLRTRIFSIVSVVAILVLFGLNLLVTGYAREKEWFIDITQEGLYTLTPEMCETCDVIFTGEGSEDHDVTVIFCADPDTLVANQQTRVPYFMALALQKRYDRFHVKTVNVTYNPGAVAAYKRTSQTTINPTDVIVTAGKKYRVAPTTGFWYADSSTGAFNSYNGEYRLVTLISSILAIGQPAAYFITGHGETVFDPENPEAEGSVDTLPLCDLLSDCGMEVRLLDLSSVDAVPDDCALLVLNDPQTDFTFDAARLDELAYRTDLEKIDRYLTERQGAMMVAKDFRLSLPNLEDMLREWGFAFPAARVADEASSLADDAGTNGVLVAKYVDDTNSYAYGIYGEISALSSAPITVVPDSGCVECAFGEASQVSEPGSFQTSRTFLPFLTTSGTAKRYAKDGGTGDYTELDSENRALNLAAVSARRTIDTEQGNYRYSYVFCAASAGFFSADLLGNESYANYDVLSLFAHNASRVDQFASMSLGGDSLNADEKYGGKFLIETDLFESDTKILKNAVETLKVAKAFGKGERTVLTVVLILVPLAVAITGAVVCVRRRFL